MTEEDTMPDTEQEPTQAELEQWERDHPADPQVEGTEGLS